MTGRDWIKFPEGGSMVIENCNRILKTKGIPKDFLYEMMSGYYQSNWAKYKVELKVLEGIYEYKLKYLSMNKEKKEAIAGILWSIERSIEAMEAEPNKYITKEIA